MTTYSKTSPYYSTNQTSGYLDVWTYRDIPAYSDDVLFEVSSRYQNRPDLLAFDLYDDVNLWWVFAVRNPSILRDPIYDLSAGIQIYLPKIDTLKTVLGI
jgi:hypothetical protein